MTLGATISRMCNTDYCNIPDNFAIFMQNDNHSRIELVCAMLKWYLPLIIFRFRGKSLRSQLMWTKIEKTTSSVDDIFTDHIHVFDVGLVLPDKDAHLLKTPAKVLANFTLKTVLRRLALRKLDASTKMESAWDFAPTDSYIYLNLLARANVSGSVDVHLKFSILRGYALHEDLNTMLTELEGITCYRKSLISFYMYIGVLFWLTCGLRLHYE